MKISLKKIFAVAVLAGAAMCVFASGRFESKKSISVLSREDGSGTRGAFIELFGIEKKMPMVKKLTTQLMKQLSQTLQH